MALLRLFLNTICWVVQGSALVRSAARVSVWFESAKQRLDTSKLRLLFLSLPMMRSENLRISLGTRSRWLPLLLELFVHIMEKEQK